MYCTVFCWNSQNAVLSILQIFLKVEITFAGASPISADNNLTSALDNQRESVSGSKIKIYKCYIKYSVMN